MKRNKIAIVFLTILVLLAVIYKSAFYYFNNVYAPKQEVVKRFPISEIETKIMNSVRLNAEKICLDLNTTSDILNKPSDLSAYLGCTKLNITNISITNNSFVIRGNSQFKLAMNIPKHDIGLSAIRGLLRIPNFKSVKSKFDFNFEILGEVHYSDRSVHVNNTRASFKLNSQNQYTKLPAGGLQEILANGFVYWSSRMLREIILIGPRLLPETSKDYYVKDILTKAQVTSRLFSINDATFKKSFDVPNQNFSVDHILSGHEPIIWSNRFWGVRVMGRVKRVEMNDKDLVLYVAPKLEAY